MRLGFPKALESQKSPREVEVDLEAFDVELEKLSISRDAFLVLALLQQENPFTDELVRDPELVDLVLGIGAGSRRLDGRSRADVAEGPELVEEILRNG